MVRNDAGGDTGRGTDFVQVEAQLTDQGGLPGGEVRDALTGGLREATGSKARKKRRR